MSTLAAIEDSHPDIYVRIDADINPTKPVHAVDSEAPAAETPVKPVTSKLRTTINHLRARAGPWSRFRGLSMFIVYMVARGVLVSLAPLRVDDFFGQFVVNFIAEVLLANLQMAWVHIVISEPSAKRFYQRIPGRKEWVKIAPVAALQYLAVGAVFYLPLALVKLFGGWDAIRKPDDSVPAAHTICKLFGIVVGPTLLAFLVAIPAQAIFIRVAASMLPEEYETIVPFDRSFGGKVVPAILGGSGKVSVADAWRTFDWPARVRYVKVIGKVFAIESVLGLVFGSALIWQAYVIAIDSIGAMVNGH